MPEPELGDMSELEPGDRPEPEPGGRPELEPGDMPELEPDGRSARVCTGPLPSQETTTKLKLQARYCSHA